MSGETKFWFCFTVGILVFIALVVGGITISPTAAEGMKAAIGF